MKGLCAEKVIVRFAPSPTGYLHIGGARTAIFNWLFARKHGGKFILRIEDTDAQRSSQESIQGILEGLEWLGIAWDEGPYFQSRFAGEHVAAAERLLEAGHAYRCFCSQDELERKREAARAEKSSLQYDGTCRRLTPEESAKKAAEKPHTLRLRVPREPGSVRFEDIVCGPVEKRYEDIEDFVILRSSGQPLYVLSNATEPPCPALPEESYDTLAPLPGAPGEWLPVERNPPSGRPANVRAGWGKLQTRIEPMGIIEVDLFSEDVDSLSHPEIVQFKKLLESVAEDHHCRLTSLEIDRGTVSFSFDDDGLTARVLKVLGVEDGEDA